MIARLSLIGLTLALLTNSALSEPLYHIYGDYIAGTATMTSNGTCKVPLRKYHNAQYGVIHDAHGSRIGVGVLDATGSTILLLGENYVITPTKISSKAKHLRYAVRGSFMNTEYISKYISIFSRCKISAVFADPNSTIRALENNMNGEISINISQHFVGDVFYDTTPRCVVNSVSDIKCKKSLQFRTKVTFKGKRPPNI